MQTFGRINQGKHKSLSLVLVGAPQHLQGLSLGLLGEPATTDGGRGLRQSAENAGNIDESFFGQNNQDLSWFRSRTADVIGDLI